MTTSAAPELDAIWFTRCPVPTASGIAHNLGWLDGEFAPDGIAVGVLQDAPPEIARHHFDHELPGLFREGGNVPALVARSQGARTRLLGLTWIEERQAIVVRAGSGIDAAAALRGARAAVPEWAATKGQSFPRAMAVSGFAGALASARLGLGDVELVEVTDDPDPSVGIDAASRDAFWPGLRELADGRVDAVYVKGARAAEQAAAVGAVVAVDLDALPDRRHRVNNGTPRPITVHESLLQARPDLLVRFLRRTLQAADWAAAHPEEVRAILARETRSGAEGVRTAYAEGFHLALHPSLAADRLDLLAQQEAFLHAHGYLAERVSVEEWVDAGPLAEARATVAAAASA
ncbi:ABC transporter substrate-binding protein [Motilibacter deserti]|uniref:ABC transporter substrate-binding protein n=1 Tax=Motilibacter deserti TaxID=2714956 RepID=A0ABX0GYB1_9ACTN|nr:ABC transporter substrate-binding protein [Motilibacter deserti]NHC15919.1 ABC transporter substrate-binding protein [Motilibacter deserti]